MFIIIEECLWIQLWLFLLYFHRNIKRRKTVPQSFRNDYQTCVWLKVVLKRPLQIYLWILKKCLIATDGSRDKLTVWTFITKIFFPQKSYSYPKRLFLPRRKQNVLRKFLGFLKRTVQIFKYIRNDYFLVCLKKEQYWL